MAPVVDNSFVEFMFPGIKFFPYPWIESVEDLWAATICFLNNMLGYHNLIVHSDSVKLKSLWEGAYQIAFRMGSYSFKRDLPISASILFVFQQSIVCVLCSTRSSLYIPTFSNTGLCRNEPYSLNAKIFWINLALEMNK